jgi:hypothetical protein
MRRWHVGKGAFHHIYLQLLGLTEEEYNWIGVPPAPRRRGKVPQYPDRTD